MQCAPGEPSYLVSIEEVSTCKGTLTLTLTLTLTRCRHPNPNPTPNQVSTCKYLVQFSSNLLCKHPAFAADKKKEVQLRP